MFDNVLIPISSEFYSRDVLKQSISLVHTLKSKIHVMYIIEKKTLMKSEERMDSYRTSYETNVLQQAVVDDQKQMADTVVFEDAKQFLSKHNILVEENIVEGEFSDAIADELQKHDYDLILMGFGKRCSLRYRLFYQCNIPIWVVSGSEKRSILAVCSNLAPNQKVPEISKQLSQMFNWPLHLLYVVDPKDPVHVDRYGKRSAKQSLDGLIAEGSSFIKEQQKQGIQASIVVGSLEKETLKAAESHAANLIIVGREQKHHSLFDFSSKSTKRKIAENCKYSVLFVN